MSETSDNVIEIEHVIAFFFFFFKILRNFVQFFSSKINSIKFQDKREDREVLRLFKILEYSTELGQNQLDRAEQLGDCHLPSLKANVDVALSMCESVLQKEDEFDSVCINEILYLQICLLIYLYFFLCLILG